MSPQIDNRTLFHAILARVAQRGWADIDEYFRECVDGGAFGDDFRKQAIEAAGKEAIRKELKRGRIKDEAGNTIRVASIIIKDKEGKKQKVYKDEMLFDVGDCVQVVRYWKDCRNVCDARVKYYVKLAIRLHGQAIDGLLPFMD